MLNKRFNYILVFSIFLAALCFKANAQNIQAEAKLPKYTIRIGEQIKFFLSVKQPAKEKVTFPKLADTLTGKVIIASIGKRDTSFDDKDHAYEIVTQSYTITSFDQGTYTIPAYQFGTSGGVIKSNEVTLQVQTVKVDTTKAIYDIKQPFAVKYNFWDWLRDNWPWVVIPLVVLLLIAGLIYYLRKRPKKEVVVKVIEPEIPVHVIALNKLKELRDKKLWQQGEIKAYYIELSDVLREYLEKRYAIKTHEKTTDEIFDGLKHIDVSGDNKNMLRQILVLSDLVKFAKEKPTPAENDESIEQATSFVINTQQAKQPEIAKGDSKDV